MALGTDTCWIHRAIVRWPSCSSANALVAYPPGVPERSETWVRRLSAFKLAPHQRDPLHHRAQLAHRNPVRSRAEPAVRADPKLLGGHILQRRADPVSHELRSLDSVTLLVHHADHQLLPGSILPPQVDVRHLAVGELE